MSQAMAYVLSLRPQSPLKRSFSDNPYLTSYSPPKANNTISTLRDITPRNLSAVSLNSLGANRLSYGLCGLENAPLPLTSRSLLDVVLPSNSRADDVRIISHVPRKRSCGLDRAPPSFELAQSNNGSRDRAPSPDPMVRINVASSPKSSQENHMDASDNEAPDILDLYDAIHVPLPEVRFSDSTSNEHSVEQQDPQIVIEVSPPPFRRWMSTLRRRHLHRRKEHMLEDFQGTVKVVEGNVVALTPVAQAAQPLRNKSNSVSSSLGRVTGMHSASITLASASIAHRSDGGCSHVKTRIENRSNVSEARKSTDSSSGACTLGPIMDESAWLRSVQRRKVIEELISSEESYIGDLKVLINDYFMLLTSVPALPPQTRASIQQNISQILQLHQDLLAELHNVVPQADVTQNLYQESFPLTKAKHIRFHSADMVPGRFAEHKLTRRLRHSLDIGRSPDRHSRAIITDTQTVGNVARVFNKYMQRFFAYEEYGAHWTTMSQDLTTICKGFQGWCEYERGIEALSKVLASENNRESSSRKALGFSDLLIKPIQRVCKYPLLFDDLCRQTPVCDDPEAHAELEKALFRLQETIREVNKAKDDPKTRRLIEISWHLQDRLAFQEQNLSRAVIFRLLGHVLLCGVLHVAYQGNDRTKGQYMICVLYKSCLILATTNRLFIPYNVVASISLANSSIEETDNGRGLQCHTAPHTWKLIFEHGHRLHEVILSACSTQEEDAWKTQLRQRIVCETHDFVEGQYTTQDMISSLSLDVKSIGPVFGHADSLVRRMSVHRAATLGAKTHISQVIIKNTQAQRAPESLSAYAQNSVTRSHSHMSSNHVPTLAPRRAERIRLETALEDVWTKDDLPFPGMGSRRVENHIRASANSVMRKLSMASIASNFSRRSPSFSSLSHTRSEESVGSRVTKMSERDIRTRSAAERRPTPTVVDFHSAPTAFLPTDFELQDTRPSGRRRRLANRAAGMERSSERSTPGRPKRNRHLSTHIISLPRMEPSHLIGARAVSGASSLLDLADIQTVSTQQAENEKHNAKDTNDGTVPTPSTGTPPPAKKFPKSKSRIFKFWS